MGRLADLPNAGKDWPNLNFVAYRSHPAGILFLRLVKGNQISEMEAGSTGHQLDDGVASVVAACGKTGPDLIPGKWVLTLFFSALPFFRHDTSGP